MRVLTIADLHGKTVWKNVDPDKHDLIIFLGDYLDSFTHTKEELISNLLDVITFKLMFSKKVVLLWGNHELNYTLFPGYCSGFRPDMFAQARKILQENKDLFKLAHQINSGDHKYLWTHAGLHSGWYNKFLNSIEYIPEIENVSLAEQLNHQFEAKNPYLFDIGHLRGGRLDVGGPLWADKQLTSLKPLKGYHQIVGHTRVNDIRFYTKDALTSITFLDCLDELGDKFYELYINEDAK